MQHHRPLALAERAQLFQHLAAMEKAGVPPDRAYALLDLGPSRRSRVDSFRKLVARGIEPPTAGANSGLFTLFETRLLRAAFGAGSPYPTYARLAHACAGAARRASTMRSRLMMPVLVLTIALFVGPLPQLVLGSISGAAYLWKALAPLVLLAMLGVGFVRMHAWFTSGADGALRAPLERLLLGVPLFGPLHLRKSARDFFESLALLLEAGVPLFDALPVAEATVSNHAVRQDLASLLPAVKAGAPLAQALGALRLVDKVQLFAFIQTGEASGTLAEMMMRHADSESEALERAEKDIADWLPRVFYACVALWMISQLLLPK